MNLLHTINTDRYKGVIAISDIHAESGLLLDAMKYAVENDFFVILLGDLIDGGVNPAETVAIVKSMLDNGNTVLVIGNHDDKMYRYAIGNPVTPGRQQLQTFVDIVEQEHSSVDHFLDNIKYVVKHRHSGHYFHFGKTIFTHGGVHLDLWDRPDVIKGKPKHMTMYGEVTGERDENGLPVRTYSWVDDIPTGHTAVVGHDRTAFGKSKTMPNIVENANNGSAIFTDTSCGKQCTDGAHLTGAIFDIVDDDLQFARFKSFTKE